MEKMVKAVIFDFDGVLVESVGVKTEAFRKLFLDYPEQVDEILAYHMAQGGLSRYKKFEYIYQNILKKPLTEEKALALGDQFTRFSHEGVVAAPFVPGAREFLEKYHRQQSLFVASGTPHEEMLRVVKDMQLEKYFRGVYGSPASKGEIVRTILKEYAFSSEEILFVGDSLNDYQGAKENDVPFIGRIHASYENPFTGLDIDYTINDLQTLDNILKDMLI